MMLTALAWASLDGAIVVSLLWLAGTAIRVPAAARAFVWWCAAAKFLFSLLWIAPIAVPVLPAAFHHEAGTPAAVARVLPKAAEPVGLVQAIDTPGGRGPERNVPRSSGTIALVAVWSTGLLIACAINLRRWRHTRNAISRSAPCSAPIQAQANAVAAVLELARVPAVRVSRDIETPLVAGLLRATVLLPAERFLRLSGDQQRMALCHELIHVKRADLWLGCVPALVERAFFFHPLARVAARQYAFWREAACDAAVIRTLRVAPQDYGRLLLDLGISRPAASLAASSAPWSSLNMKRRIAMLAFSSASSRASRFAGAAVVGLALAAMLPLRLAAGTDTATPPFGLATPSIASAPSAGPAPEIGGLAADATPQASKEKDQKLNFILFHDDNHTTMSGSTRDIRRARRFKRPGEPMLWLRKGGREYVVRDRAILSDVELLWREPNEIGERQGRLGEQQGALGERQGRLGAEQGKLGEKQGALGERQGRLGEEQAALAEGQARRPRTKAEEDALERQRGDLDRRLRALDEDMRRLDAQMRDLDVPIRELDEQMRTLDERMKALDLEMHDAVEKAEAGMRALIERAITSGLAEAVR